MSIERSSPQPPIPSELLPDSLSAYIYRHHWRLLTEEEQAAERVRTARAKQLGTSDPNGRRLLDFFRVPEVGAKFPDLMRRINEVGPAAVMRAAAERVVRENPEKAILHTCARCGALCRTPRAQQCFECGFDWHGT